MALRDQEGGLPRRRFGEARKPARPARPVRPAEPESQEEVKKEEAPPQIAPPPLPQGANLAPACPHCQAPLLEGAEFCGKCGNAVTAGRTRRKYRPGEITAKAAKRNRTRKIAGGRNVLVILAVLNLLVGGIVYMIYREDMAAAAAAAADPDLRELIELDPQAVWVASHWGLLVFLSYFLPGLIFVGLYVWAQSNPLPALVAGMAVYLTFMVMGIVLDPRTAVSILGWVIRIAIITALSNGIKSAMQERNLKRRGGGPGPGGGRRPLRRRPA